MNNSQHHAPNVACNRPSHHMHMNSNMMMMNNTAYNDNNNSNNGSAASASPLRYGPPYNTEFVDYSNRLADGSIAAAAATGGAGGSMGIGVNGRTSRNGFAEGEDNGGGLLAYNPSRDASTVHDGLGFAQQQQMHQQFQQQYHGGRPNGSGRGSVGHSIAVGGDSPIHNNNNSHRASASSNNYMQQQQMQAEEAAYYQRQQQQQGIAQQNQSQQQRASVVTFAPSPERASQQQQRQQYPLQQQNPFYQNQQQQPQQPQQQKKQQITSYTETTNYNGGSLSGAVSDTQLKAAEQARVRWAFSVDRTSRVQQPLMSAIASSNIREDLVDVVKLLSSVTNEVQTSGEPSYIAATRGVNFLNAKRAAGSGSGGGGGGGADYEEDDENQEVFLYDDEGNIVGKRAGGGGGGIAMQGTEHLRSIGIQSGLGLNRRNNETQVVEGDIASSAPTAQLDYDKVIAMQQASEDAENANGEGGLFLSDRSDVPPGHVVRYENAGIGPDGKLLQRRVVAVNPSAYTPFCSLPPEDYPVYLGEAKRIGVANRYGFVSLPRPPIELPPRRKVRAVQPTMYPHLHGRHPDIGLDETSTSQLTRAYSLWIQGTGFVPKY